MSELGNSISEANMELGRLETTDVSTPSQPFQPKNSCNNVIKPSSLSQQKLNDAFTSSSLKDISARCQNLSLNNESDEVHQGDTSAYPKRKNARKKERLKQLQIPPSPANNVNIAQPIQTEAGYLSQSGPNPVHDLFFKQISPLYASSSTRYLENLVHHPQHQYNVQQARDVFQNCQYAVSAPNTPLVQQGQKPIAASIPNTPPVVLSEPNTPRYFQNALYHPLLSHSFSNYTAEQSQRARSNFQEQPKNAESYYQKKKNNKSKQMEKPDIDTGFETYLTADEVETGLKTNALIEGVLRINPKQFQHSYVSGSDRTEQDVLIDGIKNRNRALEGDIVVVQLIDSDIEDSNDVKQDEVMQKKGKIVFIKEKVHPRTCIGSLKLMADKNRQKALFVPRDHRIPRLNIPFISWPNNFYQEAKSYENTLFLAKIFDWFDIRFGLGEIVSNIGESGDMITETKAILAQTALDVTPFGPEYRDLYPRLDYTIPDEEIQTREDCRNLCLFSIDPINCRDIDDAMSCQELENGNYEIGVHISDVAHFLAENTLLDAKVADKATTVYLVEKAYHMLPDDLCMLCSLLPGVDKLAFSVFWEISKDAKVLSHRFSKTVIHSCCQLAYEHAQAILEDREDAQASFPETYNGFEFKDMYKSIKTLGEIAAMFRKNRFENGALRIDQPKVSFCLDPMTGLPRFFDIYESKASHQLIEEFMLLANMTVATRIYDDHPKLAFLRCHPAPSRYMLNQLAKSLKPVGIELDISSAGSMHRSLLCHVGPDNTDRGKAMVLNMLCAKPMTRARYFCASGCHDEDFHHYALNVPLYTHFTSPIRRYPDIMVHRLLAASLNYREVPKWEVDKVRMIAAQCNKQKYNAKKAGELSIELYTLKYIELNSPVHTEAVVVDVREKYIDVIIAAMGLNRRIFFNTDFPGKFVCIKNEDSSKLSKMELTWKAAKGLPQTKQVVEVFSTIQVKLHKSDQMLKIETRLVRPQ